MFRIFIHSIGVLCSFALMTRCMLCPLILAV